MEIKELELREKGYRRKWEGEEERRKKERGRWGMRANSGGTVALILVDRHSASLTGRSKVTRWLQTHILSTLYLTSLLLYGHVSTHSSSVFF